MEVLKEVLWDGDGVPPDVDRHLPHLSDVSGNCPGHFVLTALVASETSVLHHSKLLVRHLGLSSLLDRIVFVLCIINDGYVVLKMGRRTFLACLIV